MELRVYNPEMGLVGITENQTSIVWTRKYFESGNFSIVLPLTNYNVNLFKLGRLISFSGAIEAGVIEDLTLSASAKELRMEVKGRFLSSYMDRRLIKTTVNFVGKTEVAMRKILTDATPLPLVELGELKGFDQTVEFQATYKNLLTTEEKLARTSGLGYRFRPDFTQRKIFFEVYEGLDKTRHQTDRAFVEFSDKFDNLNTATQRVNNQLYKNVGYVGGKGEGSERVYVTVGDDSLTGLERREVFIDAKDLNDENISQAEYLANLNQRGLEKLAENTISNSVECAILPSSNFVYRQDYDLGDIVTVRKLNWGVDMSLRITEVSEIYENGGMRVEPVLGSPLPDKISFDD